MRTRAKSALQLQRQNDFVEIRGLVPYWIINVIDAMAIHQRSDRIAVVRSVLGAWAEGKLQEAELISRVNRSDSSAEEHKQPSKGGATVKPIHALPSASKA